MNTEPYRTNTPELEPEPLAARTFRVWELTAIYRILGLAPGEARDAAVADLRMFPASLALFQEVAA